MAFCDYHACDHCGDNKTFYDAGLYFPEPHEFGFVGHGLPAGGYDLKALCKACAETHMVVVVPRVEDGADGE